MCIGEWVCGVSMTSLQYVEKWVSGVFLFICLFPKDLLYTFGHAKAISLLLLLLLLLLPLFSPTFDAKDFVFKILISR